MHRLAVSTRSGLLCAGLLVAPWMPARAEPPPPPAEITVETVAAYDADLERRVVGIWRVRLSHPQKLSLGLTAMLSRQPADYECVATCLYRGWRIQAEPGLAGGQLSVGWASLVGDRKRKKHFLTDVYLGYGVRATLLRTWGDAGVTPADQTFAGLEADFTVTRVNFSLGLMHRVSSGSAEEDWIVTGGMGWGF